MAVDFATLGITVRQDGVPEATAGLDKLTQASQRAEQAAARQGQAYRGQMIDLRAAESAYDRLIGANSGVTDATRKMTLAQMQAIEMNEKMGRSFNTTGLQVGRLRQGLTSAIAQMTGISPVAARLTSMMGVMAFGMGEVVVAMLAIGAAVWVYDKITEGARKAKEESDKLNASLERTLHLQALGPGGVLNDEAANAEARAAALQVRIAALQLELKSPDSGFGRAGMVRGQIESLTIERQNELNKAAGARSLIKVDVDRAIYEEGAPAREEAKRAAAAALEASKHYWNTQHELVMKAMEELARLRSDALEGLHKEDIRQAAELRKEIEKEVGIREPGQEFTMPHVELFQGLTPAAEKFDKMVMRASQALEDMALRGEKAGFTLEGVKNAWKRGNIGAGISAGATEGVADALSQFTPEGITASLVTTGINYIAQGFTDMAARMLDGGAAAREYARAMRQMRDEYAASIAQYKHDDLAAQLAQNMAAAEALLKQFHDTITVWDVIKNPQAAQQALKQGPIDIAAAEAKNAEMIRRQQVYAQEDLAVRNLRATGQTDAANLLAFREQQQREMQKAIDDNKDATYLNTLQTTLNNELIAYQNGLLSTAFRNSPAGFFASAYYSSFATPRGYPTDSGVSGGGADTGHPGGSLPGNRGPLVIQLVADGKVLTRVVVNTLDQNAAASSGSGTSRAASLESFR